MSLPGSVGRHRRVRLPKCPPPLALRFAVDDLRAFYTEAALGRPAKPSSKQIGDWCCEETAAGRAIFILRKVHLASPDDHHKAIAGLFLVPVRVPPTG